MESLDDPWIDVLDNRSAATKLDSIARRLWESLDNGGQSEIVTGAWTRMAYEDLPDHVVEALYKAVGVVAGAVHE